jgi:hypothetical protein
MKNVCCLLFIVGFFVSVGCATNFTSVQALASLTDPAKLTTLKGQ